MSQNTGKSVYISSFVGLFGHIVVYASLIAPMVMSPVFAEDNKKVTIDYYLSDIHIEVYQPKNLPDDLETILGYSNDKKPLQDLLKYQNTLKNTDDEKEAKNNPVTKAVELPKASRGLILYGNPENRPKELALAFGKTFGGEVYYLEGLEFMEYDYKGSDLMRVFFKELKISPPSVFIINDIDLILPVKDTDKSRTIKNAFVEHLDRLMKNGQPIYVVGISKSPGDIAPEVLQEGRMDTFIKFSDPTDSDRKDLMTHYFKDMSLSGIKIEDLVKQTSGYSRTEIFTLSNTLMKIAKSQGAKKITKAMLEESLSILDLKNDERKSISSISSQAFNLIDHKKLTVTFKDVIGKDEVKQELLDTLDFIKSDVFAGSQLHPPRGIILHGPPGTGKTLLAKAFAAESKLNFISISGGSVADMYVGMGKNKLHALFAFARKHKPALLFIDEIDALVPSRTSGISEDTHLTINELLYELDGDEPSLNEGLIIMGATNRIEMIDEAVLRPGRFDKKIFVGLPNLNERKKIIEYYMSKVNMKREFDLDKIAKLTSGLSPAELESMTQEAFIQAARGKAKSINDAAIQHGLEMLFKQKKMLSEVSSTLDMDILRPAQIETRLSDVAGLTEAKIEIKQLLDIVNNPEKFKEIGAKVPRGALLYGPPGTGKTLIARAMAGESSRTFIAVSGSAFVQEFVGVGARNVRELFEVARQYAPAIIFIDELDAIAVSRGGEGQSGGKEYSQTVNQLLVELDNVASDKNADILVLGATNRLGQLDSAILRPGRLDTKIKIPLPNLEERLEMLQYHATRFKIDKKVDLKEIATITTGFSGAEIASLLDQAAILAVSNQHQAILKDDIYQSKEQIFKAKKNITEESSTLDVDIIRPGEIKTTFRDVAGLFEAKEEIMEVVNFLNNPDKYTAMGAQLPRGILLWGPPGTGKTLMARAVAGESNRAFISVSGSAFVQRYVGEGAARVRELFEIGRENAPCIIFIDELDALAQSRDNSDQEARQTVNQLLVELDNIDENKNAGILLIGATNRLDDIDSAVSRPGRLDRKVLVRKPNVTEREQIIEYYFKDYTIDPKVKASDLAASSGGLTGAEIKSILNEAALMAIKQDHAAITWKDIEDAKDKILLGAEIKSSKALDKERYNTAYHESGHALVALMSDQFPSPFYKLSIAIRDGTLGTTHWMDPNDSYQETKQEYINYIAALFGGKMAEEIATGAENVTSGPSSDLQKATMIAQAMVTQYGMGEQTPYIAYQYLASVPKEEVNEQVKKILLEAEKRARAILTEHRDMLDKLANELLKRETMGYHEVQKLLGLPIKN